MTTHLYWHPDIFLHDRAAQHCAMAANRLADIQTAVAAVPGITPVLARPASREQLERVHLVDYLDHLYAVAPTRPGERHAFDRETVMNEHTLRAVELSAGAACHAVEAVWRQEAMNAFCTGYAGHHAGPEGAMGFCFINSLAIAARHALALGVQRLALLDFDTHSGNGTIMAFWEPDERVLFAETHQPGYPGAFMPSNRPGHILRRKCTRAQDFGHDWRKLLGAVTAFQPEMMLVSAGFDAHRTDPLGRIGLCDRDYQQLAQSILEVSPRVVMVLEGGYAVEATARCAALVVAEMVRAGQGDGVDGANRNG